MMTREEVAKKWSQKHPIAFYNVQSYVDSDDIVILFPKDLARRLVTAQIFNDFGYYFVENVKHNGKITHYKYALATKDSPSPKKEVKKHKNK